MKRIAYTLETSGVDGREEPEIYFASWDEKERGDFHKGLANNKGYYQPREIIVHVEEVQRLALAKLDGLEKLIITDFYREHFEEKE